MNEIFQILQNENLYHALYQYELVSPKYGYNDAKFQKYHLKSVLEKANDKVCFVKSAYMSVVSLGVGM